MLKITDVEKFRAAVAHKEEIREADLGHGCTSFCYMISGPETFDSAEARECRGIMFNAQGQVNGRPLHKFFNVNEREETLLQNLDWSKVVRVMDKRDGSMIHTVSTVDGIILKSKKSFESDVAKAADDWMNNQDGLHVFRLALRMSAMNKTCIFEWTAPNARIVLFYPEAELTLLHIRDNETGEYMEAEDLRKWAAEFHVKVVEEVNEFYINGKFDIQLMLNAATTREGKEGWVVQFENGEMCKIKTEWYLNLHRTIVFLRERDIAELVIDEKIDDLKSIFSSSGMSIDKILEIEKRVLVLFIDTQEQLNNLVAKANSFESRKEIALALKEHPLFSLMMQEYSGRTPNIKEFIKKKYLKDLFSLEQI